MVKHDHVCTFRLKYDRSIVLCDPRLGLDQGIVRYLRYNNSIVIFSLQRNPDRPVKKKEGVD